MPPVAHLDAVEEPFDGERAARGVAVVPEGGRGDGLHAGRGRGAERDVADDEVGVETIATATLRNNGNASSGAFTIKWFLDGVQMGYGRHDSLGPGQTSTGNVHFTF